MLTYYGFCWKSDTDSTLIEEISDKNIRENFPVEKHQK